jgi:nitrous oxidase accessory protein
MKLQAKGKETMRILVFLQMLAILTLPQLEASMISISGNETEYDRIQEAIDAADEGERIEINRGIYYENVVINKRVSLVGTKNPVIDAGKNGSAITITADGAIVEGFILRNSLICKDYPQEEGGIRLISNKNIIKNNTMTDNWDNIILCHSNDNIISNNTLKNSQEGVDLIQSDNNIIFDNYI